MANCEFCGDRSRFRTLNGRVVPFHNCEVMVVETTSTKRDDPDCCHRTVCPRCGKRYIFFVRHNGGSVWFDLLGPPWPQHACFEKIDAPEIPSFLLNIPPGVRCQPAKVVSCKYDEEFKCSVATVYLEDKWKVGKPLHLAIQGRERLRGHVAIFRHQRRVFTERGEIKYVGEWKECGVCKRPHPPKIAFRHEAKELRKRQRIAALSKKV